MKKMYLLAVLIAASFYLQAQTIATTTDGRRIILNSNGTWQYLDSFSYAGNNFTSINSMYTEAEEYAYSVIYADEFFSTERRQKAADWAINQVKNNLIIPVGRKSLEQWYDELYQFAYDHVYKNDWFGGDRRTRAQDWAGNILRTKAFFTDYNTTFIARHRAAYKFAFDRLYRQEFFAQDRRRKALDWANEFVAK